MSQHHATVTRFSPHKHPNCNILFVHRLLYYVKTIFAAGTLEFSCFAVNFMFLSLIFVSPLRRARMAACFPSIDVAISSDAAVEDPGVPWGLQEIFKPARESRKRRRMAYPYELGGRREFPHHIGDVSGMTKYPKKKKKKISFAMYPFSAE